MMKVIEMWFFINLNNICRTTQVQHVQRILGRSLLTTVFVLLYHNADTLVIFSQYYMIPNIPINWTASSITRLMSTRYKFELRFASKSLSYLRSIFYDNVFEIYSAIISMGIAVPCHDFTAYHSSGNECRHRVAYKLKLSSVWLAGSPAWLTAPRYRKVVACLSLFFFTSLCIRIKRWRPINQCYDAWHDLMSWDGGWRMHANCHITNYCYVFNTVLVNIGICN